MHLNLETVKLSSGAHEADSGECCVLELYSCQMKKVWGDNPDDVSPIIADFMRRWNDRLNDQDRQQLKLCIPWLAKTKTTDGDEITRSWMMLDYLIRRNMAEWMELADLPGHAMELRALPEIVSQVSANSARLVIDAARKAANGNAIATAIGNAIAYATATATNAYADAAIIATATNAYADAAIIANAIATAIGNAIAYATATATNIAAYAAYATADADAKVRQLIVKQQADTLQLIKRLCDVGRKVSE